MLGAITPTPGMICLYSIRQEEAGEGFFASFSLQADWWRESRYLNGNVTDAGTPMRPKKATLRTLRE
ncbi:hypothetical protein KCP75_01460 [Salmonella enterica subsp. enterica]|nr:hypothetical protein KCP75_01460 [Salmonella enterica subsp. enterica]